MEGDLGQGKENVQSSYKKKCVDLLLADVEASSQYGNKDQYALRQNMTMTMLDACINFLLQLAA